jgi:hypothetical protein
MSIEEWRTVKISEDVWRMLKIISTSGVSIQEYATDTLRQAIRQDFPDLYKSALRNTELLALRTKTRSLHGLDPSADETLRRAPGAVPQPLSEQPAPTRKGRASKRAKR